MTAAYEGSISDYGRKYDAVVLVSGKDFPDGLSASTIANSEKIPILYADSSNSQSALDYIKRNTTAKSRVYIIGGEAAVPASVEENLKKEHTVERFYGKDRYSTNLSVLNYEFKQNKSLYNGTTYTQTVFVCSGRDYPDALVASACKNPILSAPSELSSAQLAVFKDKSVKFVIVGGTGEVSSKVETQLKGLGKSVSRIDGQNRYETCIKFASKYFSGASEWVVTDANSYADALCASYLSSNWNRPLILASESTMLISDSLASSSYASLVSPSAHIYIGGIVKSAKNAHELIPTAKSDF
ncbi:MAG: cell wall-binding repeat-containing protein [Ruminococcus sp.]|nr:cell wall-binding repeat-containing protein [Ruminococcus sp.]